MSEWWFYSLSASKAIFRASIPYSIPGERRIVPVVGGGEGQNAWGQKPCTGDKRRGGGKCPVGKSLPPPAKYTARSHIRQTLVCCIYSSIFWHFTAVPQHRYLNVYDIVPQPCVKVWLCIRGETDGVCGASGPVVSVWEFILNRPVYLSRLGSREHCQHYGPLLEIYAIRFSTVGLEWHGVCEHLFVPQSSINLLLFNSAILVACIVWTVDDEGWQWRVTNGKVVKQALE